MYIILYNKNYDWFVIVLESDRLFSRIHITVKNIDITVITDITDECSECTKHNVLIKVSQVSCHYSIYIYTYIYICKNT